MKKKIEFEFLKDKPLETIEEIKRSKFGHKEIAQTLTTIVTNCPTPFTIGLFGRWGSGKSTIANFVKTILASSKIPVIVFDVWKHKGDALRRTFLKEITKQLQSYGNAYFDKNFSLDERVESSISRKSEGEFKINKKKIRHLGRMLLLIIVALVIVGVIAYATGFLQQFMYALGILLSAIFGGSFLIWLIKNAGQFLTTETTTFGQDRFKDPHQFEQEFSRILRHLVHRKIVIVFDNLDRVTQEGALKVLATIKTFLEPKDIENKEKDVIFLIPCDAGAIRKHIAGVYAINAKSSPFDPDEFLRKFFNAILWIPEFIPEELEAYARSSLRETKVVDLDNDKVAWVITKAFRENPRQIIQFINILLANYLLIKEREGTEKDFLPGFLPDNIAQLAKYLILYELFPDEMEKLRKDKVLNLQEATTRELETCKKDEFLNFVKETELDIPIANLRIFFTLRRSEHEKRFPGIESFIAFLEDRKEEEAQKYYAQLKDMNKEEKIEAFSHVIKMELENKTNPVSIASLIATLLSVLDFHKVKLTATAYGEIYNKLAGPAKSYIHTIKTYVLSRQLLKPYAQYRNVIIEQWIDVLDNQTQDKPSYKIDDKFVTDLLVIFGEQPTYLNAKTLQKLKEILAKARYSQNTLINETIIKNSDLQKRLITPAYISTFIEGITIDTDIDDILDKIDILAAFQSDLIDSNLSDQIIKKLNDIQTTENKNIAPERYKHKELLLKAYSKILNTHWRILSTTVSTQFDAFAASLVVGANAIPNINQRRIFIPVLLKIKSLTTQARLAQINTVITNFLNSADIASLEFVMQDIPEPIEFIERSDYTSIFEKKSLTDQKVFDYVYGKSSKDRKAELLTKLFDIDYNRALTKIEELNYKIPNSVAIVEKTFNKIDSLPATEKGKLLKLVNTLKCGNVADQRDTLVKKLKTYLCSTDVVSQEVGFNALSDASKHIGEERKRQLSKDVFDWIRKPNITNKYQPYAIRTIYSGYSLFNDEEQKEFHQFLFDELIRKGSNQESIKLGFGILKEIKPKYEDRMQNFNDVKHRIETEQDGPIKTAIVVGLKDLKPQRVNKQNRQYWEWVDSL